ncbi:hypothetical protein CC78DRAFT_585716 [Lojkania enalia]|uniref:Ankyrin n=1 Tax=Lojkania enalia TaxID=147567 RepID=A0A9P4MZL5_9PLEO|nr:hypothetical protein CC78DRAFT_585716 [Didymosphaeria enalia]
MLTRSTRTTPKSQEIFDFLAESGTNLGAVDKSGGLLLHLAAIKGDRPLVDLLIETAPFGLEYDRQIAALIITSQHGVTIEQP